MTLGSWKHLEGRVRWSQILIIPIKRCCVHTAGRTPCCGPGWCWTRCPWTCHRLADVQKRPGSPGNTHTARTRRSVRWIRTRVTRFCTGDFGLRIQKWIDAWVCRWIRGSRGLNVEQEAPIPHHDAHAGTFLCVWRQFCGQTEYYRISLQAYMIIICTLNLDYFILWLYKY